jgi:hypothetical protein
MAKVQNSNRRLKSAVRVDGLKELQAALRAADRNLPKQLRVANKEVADVLARRIQARALALGGVAAKVAPSIKAKGEQQGAAVTLGSSRYPFAMGANFGAMHDVLRDKATGKPIGGKTVSKAAMFAKGVKVDRPKGSIVGWNQFPEWGGNQFTGGAKDRFLYWSIVRAFPTPIEAIYVARLKQLLADVGHLI